MFRRRMSGLAQGTRLSHPGKGSPCSSFRAPAVHCENSLARQGGRVSGDLSCPHQRKGPEGGKLVFCLLPTGLPVLGWQPLSAAALPSTQRSRALGPALGAEGGRKGITNHVWFITCKEQNSFKTMLQVILLKTWNVHWLYPDYKKRSYGFLCEKPRRCRKCKEEIKHTRNSASPGPSLWTPCCVSRAFLICSRSSQTDNIHNSWHLFKI